MSTIYIKSRDELFAEHISVFLQFWIRAVLIFGLVGIHKVEYHFQNKPDTVVTASPPCTLSHCPPIILWQGPDFLVEAFTRSKFLPGGRREHWGQGKGFLGGLQAVWLWWGSNGHLLLNDSLHLVMGTNTPPKSWKTTAQQLVCEESFLQRRAGDPGNNRVAVPERLCTCSVLISSSILYHTGV